VLETLAKGGPVMIPIGLCSVLALAIVLDRLWYFWKTRYEANEVVAPLREPLKQQKYMEALQLARQLPPQLAAYVGAGIAVADKGSDDMQLHFDVAGRDSLLKMERGLSILNVITTVAPLLGLLGTVTGIINSFNVLSALQGIEGPSSLAAGIAEALITTAAGLSVAIPSAAVYEWFSHVVDKRVQDMNRIGAELLDIVAETRGGQE
jgi:biopolymer transport protein ExbB